MDVLVSSSATEAGSFGSAMEENLCQVVWLLMTLQVLDQFQQNSGALVEGAAGF